MGGRHPPSPENSPMNYRAPRAPLIAKESPMTAAAHKLDANPILDQALAYIAGGKPVFPCRPGEEVDTTTGEIYSAKTPLTGNGFRGATKFERNVRIMWERHPGAMIGI